MSMTSAADARSQAVSPVSIFSMPVSVGVPARRVSREWARLPLRFGAGRQVEIGEDHRLDALRVEHPDEVLNGLGFAVDPFGRPVSEGENVQESGRIAHLLQRLVSQGAGLVGPDIGNEFGARREGPLAAA